MAIKKKQDNSQFRIIDAAGMGIFVAFLEYVFFWIQNASYATSFLLYFVAPIGMFVIIAFRRTHKLLSFVLFALIESIVWFCLLLVLVIISSIISPVFSGSGLLGLACVASPGFACQNPILLSYGTLWFTFGQDTGSNVYNVELACAATGNNEGLPNPSTAFASINPDGTADKTLQFGGVANGTALDSGQIISIRNLTCYGAAGKPLGTNLTVGNTFSGFVWVNYTLNSGAPSVINKWHTAKTATFVVKVSNFSNAILNYIGENLLGTIGMVLIWIATWFVSGYRSKELYNK